MKLLWRITVLVGSVALICGATIVWHFSRVRANHRELTEEATAFRLRADHGDANAQYELARMYYQGKGVPQDYAEALSWYRKAAEGGDARAQYGAGFMYDAGKGVPQDYVEAASWYRKAADQGNPKAQCGLAYLYYEGKGVMQDHNAALEMWRKAADQGYARAQYALGYTYFDAKEYSTAIAWFRKAADHGSAEAQTYLGYMYSQGKGAPPDAGEAVHWYRRAVEQGYSQAQYDLGYIYYYGVGVPQDRVEANRLFHAAASQGNEGAKRFIGFKSPPLYSKVMLALDFLASVYFAVVFLKSQQSRRNRAQIVVASTAVLLMCSFVLTLFWYGYIGHLQSLTTITTLYFVRHLLSGVIAALLLFVVLPRRAKAILISAVAFFIAYVAIQAVHCELMHRPLTIRLFWFVGFPLGMAIPPAIILWLERISRGQGQGKDDAAVVTITTT